MLTGVLLVLVAVVVGAKVVAASDNSESVWVAARDLAAGTQLTTDDLRRGKVQLHGQDGRYVSAKGSPPVGYVLTRAVGRDELLPVAAITSPGEAPAFRLVTVPVAPLHMPPKLAPGERVEVYVTAKAAGERTGTPRLIYAGAVVQSVGSSSSGLSASSEVGVVLRVPPESVSTLVAGLRGGDVDLVRIPPGQGPS
jgi:Flp pilus assembly protein CpaB